MNVNEDSERKLRAAMDRILAGTPIRTNGSYTVTALAAEAGMSRRTASRATGVLRDFRDAVEGLSTAPAAPVDEVTLAGTRAALAAARDTLKERNAENARLRTDLSNLACRVAILSEENAGLLATVGRGTVVSLPSVTGPGPMNRQFRNESIRT
jgi:truncated hemoglobin YjbI